jgi:hypothetical protein
MAHICLWGNASDLSFSLQGDASTLQEKHLRADAKNNILVVYSPPQPFSCREKKISINHLE